MSQLLQKRREKYKINNQKSKTLKLSKTIEHIWFDLFLSGKTFLMSKLLSRKPNRDIYIITKSPPKRYSNSKIKIKEIGEEIKHLNEYENAIIVFDDVLGPSNSRDIDQFFIRGSPKNLDKKFLSQS